ncbi:hypothetical protein AY599_24370 [Leptolyngbya valderiana BDU 20041]|uniref:hypothetical protein n=1 Tax=Baaleninema simplex TaxID=2862350 RepID=UPI000344A111|nr:hypothetical protein [Baaleninema simplex]MDC0834136.1 hypothetical protein [Geitlerinema sp. CS-897]OAB61393.1 hypothetical protein AY599_24370 [Leptolyngbya valderiana BDU 20041]PPT06867.1 hypothetical protein CKA32_000849 [Geitlerinema sp. FC II]
MTGFIRGLFGRKKQPEQQTVKSEGSSQAYFLNQDDAKTLGDIDYMRKSRQIRRTFPTIKGASLGPTERVRQVSAMEERDYAPDTPSSTSASQSSTSSSSSDFQRRTAKTDTNMDMFRNMAKNMKRR